MDDLVQSKSHSQLEGVSSDTVAQLLTHQKQQADIGPSLSHCAAARELAP